MDLLETNAQVPRSSGDQNLRESAESAVRSFSIVEGGPVYRLLLRLQLVRQTKLSVWHRFLALLASIWLPLLLLSLKDGLAFGHQVKIPFLYDLYMYGAFLFGLPVLLFAQLYIDPSIRQSVSEFVHAQFIPDQELPRFESILKRVQQIRDSWITEVILLVLASFPLFLFEHEWIPGMVTNWHTTAKGISAAGWWYAVVSTPIIRYIVYRWVFRFILWAILLWQITGLQLTLMPTHPDHDAGLEFLGGTQKHFGLLFCALGCSVAGRIVNTMLFEGTPLSHFEAVMVGFLVVSVVVGSLQLALLTPKMMAVRRTGLLEYGKLAKAYSESFDRKWVHCNVRPSEPLLGAADIQSLADMGHSYLLIEKMRRVPISRTLVQQLAGRAVLPLVPIIIFGTPIPALAHELIKLIL